MSKILVILIFSVFLLACAGQDKTDDKIANDQNDNSSAFVWSLPDNFPLPIEPPGNLMTEAKFQLGRHLFYDKRLSGNSLQSCASCHQQNKAFSDGLPLPSGSTGETLVRNSQSLVNAGYNATLTWANPSILTLERQILIPLFGEFPIEQGITDDNREEVLQRIVSEQVYQNLFLTAYPELDEPIDYENIVKAIASFVRGLTSFDSPFDKFQRGDSTAVSDSVLRGRDLFFSEKLECFHCHGGYNFSNSILDRNMAFFERPFHNTGLFNIGGDGAFPEDNEGLFSITAKETDMGKFRAVTLRNIELTAPYMHDGSISSLEEVIDFYAAGGRVIKSGPNAGDGRNNPFKDGFIIGFELTVQEKTDVLSFLKSLTDENFVNSERFNNPWVSP